MRKLIADWLAIFVLLAGLYGMAQLYILVADYIGDFFGAVMTIFRMTPLAIDA